MPAIADPGSSVVRAAHDLGLAVVPLVGPVSLLLALAASGLNGQNFAFVGYLPQDAAQRAQRIKELEALAFKTGQAQLFIETPYRNAAMWDSLLKTLQPPTRLGGGQRPDASRWVYPQPAGQGLEAAGRAGQERHPGRVRHRSLGA